MKRDTRIIHSGRSDEGDGLVNPAIKRASTVLAPSTSELYEPTGTRRHYGRGGVAPNGELRAAIRGIYGADHCALAPSGLASVVLAIRTAIKGPGEALISDGVYGPVRRFCDEELPRLGVTPVYYDPQIGSGIALLITSSTALIALESPSSLTFELQDVPAIAQAARNAGVPTVIDDTWTAGLLMNPLEMGIDYAAQALTKYVGGHSDFLMGSVAARGEAAKKAGRPGKALRPACISRRRLPRAQGGCAPCPCGWNGPRPRHWRLPGGWRRTRKSPASCTRLCPHTLITRCTSAIFSGAAGCFSFVLNGIGAREGEAVVDLLNLFGIGFSWGGYESLALACDRQIRRTATPWKAEGALLRLSIGLEDVEDLWADLEQALDQV